MVYRRAGWAFVDQGIVSLGGFLTNIILARELIPAEYGEFALLLTVSFSAALALSYITNYPLGLGLAHARAGERTSLITGAIGFAAAACLLFSAAIAGALAAIDRSELILPATTSFFCWQMQMTTRRAMLADLRQRDAVIGDAVSSLGLLATLIASMGTLSLTSALYYIAIWSLLGAVLQSLQLRLRPPALHKLVRWPIENAPLSLVGPPLAAAGVWTFRVYGLFWLLAALEGTAAVASLQAALTIFNALNPLYYSLINVVIAVTARAFDGIDRQAAWRAARPFVLIALPPAFLYIAVALSFPGFLLLLFYGHGSPYLQIGSLFPYLALYAAAMFPAELINVFFLGMRKTRLVLKNNLIAIAVAIMATPPLLLTLGLLEGVCAALAVSEVVRLMLLLLCLRKLANTETRAAREARGEAMASM